jgi:hypothetical protein
MDHPSTPLRPGGAWRNIREYSSLNTHQPIPPRSTRPPVASRPMRNLYFVGDGPTSSVVACQKVQSCHTFEPFTDAHGSGKENVCPSNADPPCIEKLEKQPKEIQVWLCGAMLELTVIYDHYLSLRVLGAVFEGIDPQAIDRRRAVAGNRSKNSRGSSACKRKFHHAHQPKSLTSEQSPMPEKPASVQDRSNFLLQRCVPPMPLPEKPPPASSSPQALAFSRSPHSPTTPIAALTRAALTPFHNLPPADAQK